MSLPRLFRWLLVGIVFGIVANAILLDLARAWMQSQQWHPVVWIVT